jgi:hypothetical protein
MEQAETIQQPGILESLLGPLSPLLSPFRYSPEQLREENETLKKIIAFQDERNTTLAAENADLHRLLGLRGETVALEQQIEQRNTEEGD